MKQPAYDKCYLDMMFQKTRFLFRLMERNNLDVFETITDYMTGEYRKYMDMGNPLYLNKTPKQILGDMGYRINLKAAIGQAFDEMILDWMADIYVYMQWKYALWSAEIVKKVKPEELYKMYTPLHEASVENGCEKLIRRFNIIGVMEDCCEKAIRTTYQTLENS